MTTTPHHRETEELIRTVGFWGLVAMCINAVVGSSVFLLPTESYRLLGAFSLWAPLLFAVPVFILVLCFAEASSHFSEPGGAYLYARTAFVDFIGFATGWIDWIARVTSMAALSDGFGLSLLSGIAGIGAIYVLAQLGAMASLTDLSHTDTPIASAAASLIGPIGGTIVTLGAVLSMAGTNSGTMLEGSRMLFALSLDRKLGPVSYVHPRFRTPSVAIIIHATVALIFALSGSFATLALISAVARLTTYLFTCAAVPRLRKLGGSFRTPGLVIPILGTLISLWLIVTMNWPKIIVASIAMVVGAIVYLISKPARGCGEASANA